MGTTVPVPPRVRFPWYDSVWLSSYQQARAFLARHDREKLEEFERALSVFRTEPGFQTVRLSSVFDDQILERIRRTVAGYSVAQLELHELESFGRFVVHDDPFFLELQEGVADLVSGVVGEQVEACYNFLSLYQGDARCAVHMDAPSAKWTLDICVDQSRPWPIEVSDVVPWPETWESPAGDWEDEILQTTTFTPYTMSAGEAIIFGGSSQWHYRDPMPQATSDDFCTLLFFHYVPAGSAALSQPENWPDIFDVPELRSVCR
jgi:hypothetical protein